MTFDEIRFALSVNGVDEDDVEKLLGYCKKNGTDYKVLDEMLIEMGYEKIFTDEFFGWIDEYNEDEDYDDEYFSSEKMRHKHDWED